jgi:serine/threonine-protein kinase RsbW
MAAQFKIALPAQMDYFEAFQTSIAQYAREQGFDPKRIGEIELVLEEALVNVFHYAYRETKGVVEVVCRVDPQNSLIIEIMDQGVPFNPLLKDAPNLALDISERKIGGLGIYFIKTLMDEIHYRREGDYNILSLVVYKKEIT